MVLSSTTWDLVRTGGETKSPLVSDIENKGGIELYESTDGKKYMSKKGR